MKMQIDLPKGMAKQLAYVKLDMGLASKQEVIVRIIDEYFAKSKDKAYRIGGTEHGRRI